MYLYYSIAEEKNQELPTKQLMSTKVKPPERTGGLVVFVDQQL